LFFDHEFFNALAALLFAGAHLQLFSQKSQQQN
jgi:hypothetical protein